MAKIYTATNKRDHRQVFHDVSETQKQQLELASANQYEFKENIKIVVPDAIKEAENQTPVATEGPETTKKASRRRKSK